MNPQASTILWLTPLIIGAIIAILNSDGANDATEKAEAWLRRAYANAAAKNSWFIKIIVQPLLWLVVKFSDWTDSLPHRGLKNGMRIATAFYFLALWGFILLHAVRLVVILAVIIGILYIAFRVLLSDPNVRRGYNIGKGIFGPTDSGKRVNPDTGVIQKRGFWGWEDTGERINPDTGQYQERGLFGWDDSDTRVNPESGVLQERGLFGYDDTDVRINPETGIIQKKGMFGWDDTDERIDPKTGKHQKKGMFGWEDD